MKENKFMMGEEEENSKTTTTSSNVTHKKQPVRHHVKRRSSGRVHVAKLAPMARANAAHTDSETELDKDNENNTNNRPTMRRSQSQRSLHRMSLDRKGFTTLTKRKSTPIETLTMQSKKEEEEEEEVEEVSTPADEMPPTITTTTNTKTSSTHSTSNPASLSSRMIAAPVEQTFNAVANTLVIPKTKIIPKIISQSPERMAVQHTTTTTKKPFLKSQFINSYEEPSSLSNKPDFGMTTINSKNNKLSRTQQKLLLQKQQSQVEDETSPIHPRNMQKINKELELLSKENRCIKRYQDPMRASLIRCLDKKTTRNGLGANKQFASTSTLPTMIGLEQQQQLLLNSKKTIPHLEQRQIAHRHHHLKTIALTRNMSNTNDSSISTHDQSTNGTNPLWNATTALLDRMFNN